MPRSRGEADKLGNHYEGIWTVDSLLDLLSGEALSLQPEPFDEIEAEGIEFIKSLPNSISEYHSVKRQKVGTAWTLADLARKKPNGRSPLGDLFAKLAARHNAQAIFISQTGANELLELCDRARRCATTSDLDEQLKTSKALAEDFKQYILPLSDGDASIALDRLKRLRAIPFEERELIRRVAQRMAQLIYRPDRGEADPDGVRRLLVEFVINRLGQHISKSDVVAELRLHGFHLRVWAGDRSLLSRVAALNETYLEPVRRQFINGRLIPRAEAALAAKHLTNPGPKGQLIVGPAGLGKTCVVAEAVSRLEVLKVPVLSLRLDNLPRISTTENLGRELGLPASPAVILAGIADGGRCVLVVDQLDALSMVSGRNEHLWPVFDQLIAEANSVPNMRLLLGCRAFDLQHDARLRGLTGEGRLAASIELSPLAISEVDSAVRAAGGDPQRFDTQQIELLRTPFNLQLFLQGDPQNNAPFYSVKDLFHRYWEHKSALVVPKLENPQAWNDCISILAQALSNGATSAPADILDRHNLDANTMASEGVLVLENRRFRFFHETFGDYAFAREFVRDGQDLVKFLVNAGEQHLFRRAQVRQILAYERDRDRVAYIRTLHHLMEAAKVRLHIKKLALEWMSLLGGPGEDEWRLVEALLPNAVLGSHALSVISGRVPWFDLLYRLGAWPNLLGEDRNYLGEHCANMIAREMMRERSVAVADLFAPHRQDMPKWENRFRLLFRFGQIHHSREIFDLTLACVDDGFFDDLNDRNDLLVHQLSEHRPDYGVEFVARYLDRLCVVARQEGKANPFSNLATKRKIRDSEIRSIAEKAPLEFVRQIAPRLQRLIVANALPAQESEVPDEIWRYIKFGAEHDLKDALLYSTARALHKVAGENPAALDDLTESWAKLPYRTIRYLLLRTWAGNGPVFADKAAAYLIANPTGLTLGYGVMVCAEGDPRAAIGREVLEAIVPHCGTELHGRLESVIRSFHVAGRGDAAKGQRIIEFALLKCLRPERLSQESQTRLAELGTEFPQAAFSQPNAVQSSFVHRVLPGVDFNALTDEGWVELFQRYNKEDRGLDQNVGKFSIFDLIRSLQVQANAERERFAALTERMSDDVLPIYFSTILQAIGNDATTPQGAPPAGALNPDTLFKVMLRLHSLPNCPCGKAICWILYRIADQGLPSEMLDMVGYYALEDPDPPAEGDEREGKQLVDYAINTARGNAVDAIAKLLFANPDLATRFLPIIEKLAGDSSPSIRAITIHALIALLNRDRGSAVRLFHKICDNNPRIWSSHHVEDFLFYATFSHYTTLQPLLYEMLNSGEEEAKSIAGRQICLAAFRHPEAEADLPLVLVGDSICRKAAAQVYTNNLLHPSVRAICERRLIPLLNDPDSVVRGTAGYWVTNLKTATAGNDWTFLREYLETEAFAEEPGICLHELHQLATIPMEITLRLASRAIEVSKRDLTAEPMKAYRFASDTPTLVVRLYHQAEDEPTRKQCLDLLDSMLEFGWNEAAIEMAKAER